MINLWNGACESTVKLEISFIEVVCVLFRYLIILYRCRKYTICVVYLLIRLKSEPNERVRLPNPQRATEANGPEKTEFRTTIRFRIVRLAGLPYLAKLCFDGGCIL